MINKEILQKAIDTYDEISQLEMIKEEAMELALSIQKAGRSNNDKDDKKILANIYNELANMKIMLAQAELIFDTDKIDKRVEFKMNHLEQRLKKYE